MAEATQSGPKWRFTPPFNINKWIEENKEKLKPPVANYMLYKDGEFQARFLVFCCPWSDCHRLWFLEVLIVGPISTLSAEKNGFTK